MDNFAGEMSWTSLTVLTVPDTSGGNFYSVCWLHGLPYFYAYSKELRLQEKYEIILNVVLYIACNLNILSLSEKYQICFNAWNNVM